jgi:pimeloyl-ACP methyl ester carboxylesterase
LFQFARLLTTVLSLAVLGAVGWLAWSWWQGEWLRNADGVLVRVREDWRLWAAGALLAWSFLGRFLVLPLLARPDRNDVTFDRAPGMSIPSPTGSTLHLEMIGPASGQPIIFTHGWGMDSTIWAYQKRHLADRFRLVFWDLPGLGRSRAADGRAISVETFARDLEAVIEAAGSRPPILVGHSIGGMTIQTLLRDKPQIQDQLAGVVLLNTTYTDPLKTMVLGGLAQALRPVVVDFACWMTIALNPLVWLSQWQSYLSGWTHIGLRIGYGGDVTRRQLEHSALLATRNAPAAQARGNLAMTRWDATGALAGLRKRIVVVGGDIDIVTKLEASRTIAGETPFAHLEVVRGANHMGPVEQADLYDRIIADVALAAQPPATRDAAPETAAGEDRTVAPGAREAVNSQRPAR